MNSIKKKRPGPPGTQLCESFCQMYRDGSTITEVAEAAGLPLSTTRNALRRSGVTFRSISKALQISRFDRAAHASRVHKGRPKSEKTKEALRKKALERCAVFAKGTTLKPSGYIEVTRGPNKGKGQHRVIMEQFLGRELRTDEVVHHKDRDKANNKIENLQVMTNREHTSLHRREGW